MEKEYLQTSELMEATNLGRETLRFYENKGLIPDVPRTDAGYRLYPKKIVDRLLFVKDAQEAGFTLKEIKELIDLQQTSQATCGDVSPLLNSKLNSLEIELEILKKKQSVLKNLATSCGVQTVTTPCSIIPCSPAANSCS